MWRVICRGQVKQQEDLLRIYWEIPVKDDNGLDQDANEKKWINSR